MLGGGKSERFPSVPDQPKVVQLAILPVSGQKREKVVGSMSTLCEEGWIGVTLQKRHNDIVLLTRCQPIFDYLAKRPQQRACAQKKRNVSQRKDKKKDLYLSHLSHTVLRQGREKK